ncbi:hypothetical protein, conserved [Leishmania tarentolae]|uniref:Uncharacterized protein n=1 Tax=Leishmania tarentolae TaxID=5689 RepID=A0A640KN66_LEITA|nr:hypothetical protein, conserved [Leishmania tarentolae]
MIRRTEKEATGEGHRHHHHRLLHTGRKRRHEEEDSSNTPPLSSTSDDELHQSRRRVKSSVSQRQDCSSSRCSSSSGQHCCGHCRHCKGDDRRADVDDCEDRGRDEDHRHDSRQHNQHASDSSVRSRGNRLCLCPTSLHDSASCPQGAMTASLPASSRVLPTTNLAVCVTPGAMRVDNRKRRPEEIVESPQTPTPRIETMDERKQLFRTRLKPTPLRAPTAEGAEWRGKPLGASSPVAGAMSNDSVLGAPLLRPPMSGVVPSVSASPCFSQAKTVPFSEKEYFAWLCTPASTERRASAAGPPEAAASSRGITRTERTPLIRSEGGRRLEPSRGTGDAMNTLQPHLSSGASDLHKNPAPARLQGVAAGSMPTTPNPATPLAPQQGEISYKSSFSVLTSWDSLMAAPQLLRTTPRMPSLLTPYAGSMGTPSAQLSRLTSSTHTCVSVDAARIPSTASRGELLSSTFPEMEQNEAIQGEQTHADAVQQQQQHPIFPSSCCTRSPTTVSSRLTCDGHGWSRADLLRQIEEDGARTFVTHFSNGLVFVDPPWFICPVLLDNCEHPYYMTWLDELEVGSVEEAVAEAKAKLLPDA